MNNFEKSNELPPITKEQLIYRIKLMRNNCKSEEARIKLDDVLFYMKRLKV